MSLHANMKLALLIGGVQGVNPSIGGLALVV
jgi:hypothetical protein